MSWADSGQTQMLLGFETVYGTTPAVPASKKMPFDSHDLGVEDPPIYVETLGNGAGNPSVPAYGNKDDRGNVVVPVELVAIGHWLKLMLGVPASTGDAPLYTHVFKKGTTVPPSAFIEIGHPDVEQYFIHNGVKADRFNIAFGNNRPLTASLSLLASKETPEITTVDDAPTDISDVGVRLADPDLTVLEDGEEVDFIEQISLTLENRLESSFGLGGGGNRTRCQQKKIRVYGSITALFEDGTLLAKGRNNLTSSLEMILSTGGDHSLTFLLPELKFSYKSPAVNGNAGLKLSLNFEGFLLSNDDDTSIKVTLVNDQAAAVYA